MKRRSDKPGDPEQLRQKLIGLGERSLRKSYFPQLQSRQVELERFRALLDHSKDAIVLINAADLKVVDANATTAVMLASPKSQLMGRYLYDLLEYAQAPSLQEMFASQPAQEPLVAEGVCSFKAAESALLPIEFTANKVAFAGDAYIVFVGRDISDRLQAEAALRESEERLQLLANNLPNAMVFQMAVSPSGEKRFLYVSGNVERLFEVSPESVLANPAVLYDQVVPEFRPALAASQSQAMRNLTPFNFELQCRLPSGRLRWFNFSSTPRILSDATVLWDGVSVDVSQRKQAEEEKERIEKQFRQAQKMEAVGTLAGGIAHDFNNFLSVIIGYAEMAIELSPQGNEVRQALANVLHASERAGKLIKKILTFSRKVEVEMRPINLNEFVLRIQEILEHTLPRMITIETNLAPILHPIRADANQMEQVLLNLATNAADAMPEGGKLSISTENTELNNDFCCQDLEVTPGQYTLLTFSDTGVGMDERTREKIFDPFFTTKEIGRGTGLGLSTVYGIVTSHGGYIYCYSEPGSGTVFKIFLPAFLDDSSSAQGTTPSPVMAALGGEETILFVDDEEPLLELGSRSLSSRGYHVLTARNGEEALEVYKNRGGRFDLVIMDLSMPGMGGRKCLREILAVNPHAKVLIASGYSANAQVRSLLESGAAAYLAKPFRQTDLLATVRSVLDGK